MISQQRFNGTYYRMFVPSLGNAIHLVTLLTTWQCSQSDLICCALVSQHFRELASALLYRSFNILFPDDDDVRFESPIDGLAGGLDTFTTSDYNYAKHLRELSMDTVSTGVKAEHAYKPYLYSTSCGKFLNTLLYLTLQKARSLESFRYVSQQMTFSAVPILCC